MYGSRVSLLNQGLRSLLSSAELLRSGLCSTLQLFLLQHAQWQWGQKKAILLMLVYPCSGTRTDTLRPMLNTKWKLSQSRVTSGATTENVLFHCFGYERGRTHTTGLKKQVTIVIMSIERCLRVGKKKTTKQLFLSQDEVDVYFLSEKEFGLILLYPI